MKNMKSGLLKFIPVVIVVALLGWGISSRATDDIKSATANFSVLGTVSEISEDGITLNDAKGSDKSGKTAYELNISHLEEMEMNTYVPLNFSDIKVRDRVIAQGLTNGDTFFIKRIISFTSTPTPVESKVATSTATTTDEVASSTATTTEEVTSSSTPSSESDAPAGTTTSTSTDEVATTTSTSTEEVATSTPSIVEAITNVIGRVIDTVTETVQGVIDAVTGSEPTPESVPVPQSPSAE